MEKELIFLFMKSKKKKKTHTPKAHSQTVLTWSASAAKHFRGKYSMHIVQRWNFTMGDVYILLFPWKEFVLRDTIWILSCSLCAFAFNSMKVSAYKGKHPTSPRTLSLLQGQVHSFSSGLQPLVGQLSVIEDRVLFVASGFPPESLFWQCEYSTSKVVRKT